MTIAVEVFNGRIIGRANMPACTHVFVAGLNQHKRPCVCHFRFLPRYRDYFPLFAPIRIDEIGSNSMLIGTGANETFRAIMFADPADIDLLKQEEATDHALQSDEPDATRAAT